MDKTTINIGVTQSKLPVSLAREILSAAYKIDSDESEAEQRARGAWKPAELESPETFSPDFSGAKPSAPGDDVPDPLAGVHEIDPALIAAARGRMKE